MQKQSILASLALVALIALSCYFSVAQAGEEETNEELKRGGGVGNIFHHDVHDKGVPKLVEPQKRDCRSMPNKIRCETCCAETNRAFIWSRDVRILKMRWHGCTCSNRVPKKE